MRINKKGFLKFGDVSYIYVLHRIVLTAALLFHYIGINSSLLVSEVNVDETGNRIKYIELINISNIKISTVNISIDNGIDTIKVNDSAGFLPQEIKLIAFPEMSSSQDTILDSTKVLFAETDFNKTSYIALTVDNTDFSDTLFMSSEIKSSICRNKVLVDEEFNPISSEFSMCSPSPFNADIKIRMKNIMSYGYDNSGNRVRATGKTIIYDEEQDQPKIEIIPVADKGSMPIRIYPNPTYGNVTVEMPEAGNYEFRLNDLQSNILTTVKIKDDIKAIIQMSNLPFSIYILSIYEDGNFVSSVKIIKR